MYSATAPVGGGSGAGPSGIGVAGAAPAPLSAPLQQWPSRPLPPRPPAEPPASLYLGAHHERAFWSAYRIEGLLRMDAFYIVMNLLDLTVGMYLLPHCHKARAPGWGRGAALCPPAARPPLFPPLAALFASGGSWARSRCPPRHSRRRPPLCGAGRRPGRCQPLLANELVCFRPFRGAACLPS